MMTLLAIISLAVWLWLLLCTPGRPRYTRRR